MGCATPGSLPGWAAIAIAWPTPPPPPTKGMVLECDSWVKITGKMSLEISWRMCGGLIVHPLIVSLAIRWFRIKDRSQILTLLQQHPQLHSPSWESIRAFHLHEQNVRGRTWTKLHFWTKFSRILQPAWPLVTFRFVDMEPTLNNLNCVLHLYDYWNYNIPYAFVITYG